jgi:adenylate cyclase
MRELWYTLGLLDLLDRGPARAMATTTATRRLVAILAADVAGYSRLMGADAEGTGERLEAHRRSLVDPKIAEHHGRVVKTTGDEMLVEFPSVVDAVRCAVEVQRGLVERDADTVPDRRIMFRIGVNLGDVTAGGNDLVSRYMAALPVDKLATLIAPVTMIYGEGVNIAARLRALAEPGGICISQSVRDEIRDEVPDKFEDIGEHRVENIATPVRAYAMSADAVASMAGVAPQLQPKSARRRIILQNAVVAAGVVATLSIWIVAGWAWLEGSLSTAPKQALVAESPKSSPVSSVVGDDEAHAPFALALSPEAPPPPPLSIVVLPFASRSNDQDQGYFADAITDEVTADLSRISGSFVIARNTAFTYKGKSVEAKQLGRGLGVRYVLEGDVGRAGDQVRVNAHLVDGETGTLLWEDRFDTDRAKLAEVRHEITGRLAQTLNLELMESMSPRIEQEEAIDPDARDWTMRGWAWYHRPYSTATWQEAQRAFERALAIDPRAVDARIGLATVLGGKLADGWGASLQQDGARAEQLLREALERDANSSVAHFAMGALRQLQNRLTEAQAEYETAIVLDHNSARAFYQLGVTLMYLGQPEAALPRIEKAIQLDPHDANISALYWALGTCHLLLGHEDEAIDLLTTARAANARLWFPHLYLAGAFGIRGDLDEARAALAESIRLKPAVSSLARMRFYNTWITNPQHWALQEQTLNVGLRRAGFPDK